MLWDLYQEKRISETKAKAERTASKADAHGEQIANLQRSVDHLTLACQAMWELLRDNTSLTEEMLDAKIQEVDLRDGQADGRITEHCIDCPSCGARSNSRRETCVMCGAKLTVGHHVFEG